MAARSEDTEWIPLITKYEDIARIAAIITKEGVLAMMDDDEQSIGSVAAALRSDSIATLETTVKENIARLEDSIPAICRVVEVATLRALRRSGLDQGRAQHAWADNVERINGLIMDILAMGTCEF